MALQNSIYAPTPIAVAKGGTGNTAALTNGQLLIGNTGNVPTPATLTAGTDIGIVNAAGSITINSSLPNPLTVARGGTNNTTNLANGQLWVGNGTATPAIANLTAGTNVSITNGAGTITIASSAASAVVLANPTNTQTLAPNTTYLCTNTSVGITTFTLPSSPVAGNFYQVIGGGNQGWRIAQNASQQIFIGTLSTTAGTGGSVNSTTTGGSATDSVIIYCQSSTVFIGLILSGKVNLI